MQWELIKSSPEIIEYIDNTLGDFNKSQVNYNSKMDYLPLNFHIKDEAGSIIAGINAFACWQMLWLNELYVDKDYRGKGLGALLLDKIEQDAKQSGSLMAQTFTFDFQAKDFYVKAGYEVFGVIDNCPEGHQCFYLKKSL